MNSKLRSIFGYMFTTRVYCAWRRLAPLVLLLILLRAGIAQIDLSTVPLPSGTEVEIELLETLSSENLRVDQSIAFRVNRPVVVKGAEVIPAGTLVLAKVTAVKAAGAWRRQGSFNLAFTPVKLANGYAARLDFHHPSLRGTRAEKTAGAIGTSLGLAYYFPLAPVALIAGSKKGQAYQIRSGERYLVYVVGFEQPPDRHSSPPSTTEQ